MRPNEYPLIPGHDANNLVRYIVYVNLSGKYFAWRFMGPGLCSSLRTSTLIIHVFLFSPLFRTSVGKQLYEHNIDS